MLSSDELHNQNCFRYLKAIKTHVLNNRALLPSDVTAIFNTQHFNSETPVEGIAYGNFYTQCIKSLEQWFESPDNFNQLTTSKSLRLLAIALYQNDNDNLKQTFNAIESCTSAITPLHSKPPIRKHTQDKRDTANIMPPSVAGSHLSQGLAFISPNFKPQQTTSIPTVRRYQYNQSNSVTEIRMGTQAQRHNAKVRISPLFEAYLKAMSLEFPKKYHLYINNLPLDRVKKLDKVAAAITHEIEYTNALIKLETPDNNVIVITLPAAGGYIDSKKLKDERKDAVLTDMLNIAMGKPSITDGICDFYLSKKARGEIFKNERQSDRLSLQLNRSLQALGLSDEDILTPKQQQALWFHFIKFELTQYIINQIDPASFNFTCKDGIDRGGVSSAYYNLLTSFGPTQSPFTWDELDQALHAAPTMVKGRGMNFHRDIFWNAINHYVNANFDTLFTDPKRSWLIYWRDMNCPQGQAKSLVKHRVSQSLDYLNKKQPRTEKEEAALAVIACLDKHLLHKTSGQRLLLEAHSRTLSLLMTDKPTIIDKKAYQNLIKTIEKDNTKWKMLAGMMTMFLAVITLSPKRFHRGQRTFNAGFYKEERDELTKKMSDIAEPGPK